MALRSQTKTSKPPTLAVGFLAYLCGIEGCKRRSTAFARNSGVGTAGPAAVVNGVVLEGEALDVVVGGLGLGYTAVAALRDPRVADLLVVDVMRPVIEWHEKGMVPLGETLTGDPRCRLIEGDFFALAGRPEIGFDPGQPGRKFHAVLLDIDHSPQNLLDEKNATFYSADGLRRLAAQLLPGGVFALWSDDPPDENFLKHLAEVFESPQAHVVKFPNPLLERDSASTVYVARKRPATTD